MSAKSISGVFAAVLTPRLPDESVNVPALRMLLRFLLDCGINGLAVNGATGEFCLTTPQHLRTILNTVKEESQGRARVLCGVGAAGTATAMELARVAGEEGADALLLPMPYFFPYAQEDLDAFCRTVAAGTSLDILLYNLPQFTTGLDTDTVHRLIQEVPNIIGIKDSSGSLDILRHLTEQGVDACRIVGNDSALAPAMTAGLCDGVVSGVACALPELIQALYAEHHHTGGSAFADLSASLAAYIAQLDPFPTPWGIKWTLEARGILPATFAQPVTPHRLQQAQDLSRWYAQWAPAAPRQ